jgi:hypothetical protein
MKKRFFKIFLLLVTLIVVVSCNNPKTLAKQTVELMDDPIGNAGKLAEIQAEVYKLSPKDQGIYTQEVIDLFDYGKLLDGLSDFFDEEESFDEESPTRIHEGQ